MTQVEQFANINTATYSNVTGDKPRPAEEWTTVALEGNLPIIFDESGKSGTNTLAKKDHVVNSEALSGKKLGAMCLIAKKDGSEISLAIAAGSKKTDKWFIYEASATSITPAAAAGGQ